MVHVVVQKHNAEKALFMATLTRKCSVLSEDQEGTIHESGCNRQQTEFTSTFIVNNNTQQIKQRTKNKKRVTNIYHIHIIVKVDEQKSTLAE